MELLDKTSSRMPALAIAISCLGAYCILSALGHDPVQVPHWMQSRISSPPGMLQISSTKVLPVFPLGSIAHPHLFMINPVCQKQITNK
jgi:hypothetical protein